MCRVSLAHEQVIGEPARSTHKPAMHIVFVLVSLCLFVQEKRLYWFLSCDATLVLLGARTLLGAKGIATRSEDATRGSWPHHYMFEFKSRHHCTVFMLASVGQNVLKTIKNCETVQ